MASTFNLYLFKRHYFQTFTFKFTDKIKVFGRFDYFIDSYRSMFNCFQVKKVSKRGCAYGQKPNRVCKFARHTFRWFRCFTRIDLFNKLGNCFTPIRQNFRYCQNTYRVNVKLYVASFFFSFPRDVLLYFLDKNSSTLFSSWTAEYEIS